MIPNIPQGTATPYGSGSNHKQTLWLLPRQEGRPGAGPFLTAAITASQSLPSANPGLYIALLRV